MTHDTKSNINSNLLPKKTEHSNVFVHLKNNNWSNTMEPITPKTTTSSTSLLQTMLKTGSKFDIQQNINNVEKDTFTKQDKKNVAKNVAISTGIALLAYSVFALVKYRKNYGGLFSKLAEPIKVLKARINPNGFKPSVKIEEDELIYLNEIATHLKRLTESQREKYIKFLYGTTTFTEQGKNDFIRHFGRYIES